MAVDLPLFPLGTVLFPHMPMQLHIFEERYREMMRDCQEQGTSFGVVGIRQGVEAGGPAAPYGVGTLARLHLVEPLDDGRYNLVIVGTSRFRVTRIDVSRPYLVATVEYLPDARGGGSGLAPLAERVGQAFLQYARALGDLADVAASSVELPDDPELLSYLVSSSLQVETAHKQELLELDSAEARLRRCLTLLRREAVLLEQSLARQDPRFASISLN